MVSQLIAKLPTPSHSFSPTLGYRFRFFAPIQFVLPGRKNRRRETGWSLIHPPTHRQTIEQHSPAHTHTHTRTETRRLIRLSSASPWLGHFLTHSSHLAPLSFSHPTRSDLLSSDQSRPPTGPGAAPHPLDTRHSPLEGGRWRVCLSVFW